MKRWHVWQMSLGIGATLMLLLLNAGVSYRNILRLSANKQEVAQSRDRLAMLEKTFSTLKDAETGQRGYLLTGRKAYLQPYNAAIAQIQQQIQELDQLGHDNVTTQDKVGALELAIELKLAELEETIQLRRTRGLGAALQIVQSDRGKQEMEKIRQIMASIQAQEQRQLATLQQEYQAHVNLTLLTFTVVNSVSIFLLGSIAWIHARNEAKRQEIETRLRESEQRYASLVTAAPVGIFRMDAEGQCVYVSEGWCQMSGLTLEASLGHQWQQALHPDERQWVAHEWMQSVRENRPFKLEYRFQHTNGEVMWVFGQVVAEYNTTGEITGYVGTITNISDRKAVEFKLLERENLLDLLIQYAPVNIAMYDREMRYLLVTQHLVTSENLGSIEALLGRSEYEARPQLPEHWKTVHQRCLAGAVERCDEDSFMQPDGQIVWTKWEARPWYTPEQSIGGIIIFSDNITERKRMEDDLRQSEERFRKAILNAPLPIALHTSDGVILQINQVWSELTGYTAEELPTIAAWTAKAYPEDTTGIEETIQRLHRLEERVSEGEFKVRTANGDIRIWDFYSAPLGPLPDGRSLVISTAIDITERQQAEAALQQLNTTLEQRVAERTAQLEEINQELQAFTYSVSHDLRAPLRIMQGFTQALQEDYGDHLDEIAHSYMQSITTSAIQMDSLIGDLLSYSRLTRTQIQLTPTDLNQVVAASIQQLQAQIAATEAYIAIAPNLPSVLAHSPTLVQVITNLISNAIKFVETGVQPQITIEWSLQDNDVCLSVRDNGIGIDVAHQQRIFRVFERLHGVETYPGTGIGLAIVDKGIERMNGRAGVESHLGNGSRFWITLPHSRPTDETP